MTLEACLLEPAPLAKAGGPTQHELTLEAIKRHKASAKASELKKEGAAQADAKAKASTDEDKTATTEAEASDGAAPPPKVVLRWKADAIKGLTQRTPAACSEQSDYRRDAFTFGDGGGNKLLLSKDELRCLLGVPLGNLSNLTNLLSSSPLPSAPTALPFDLDAHPDATSENARSCLQRLKDDMKRFASRPLKKVDTAGLPMASDGF